MSTISNSIYDTYGNENRSFSLEESTIAAMIMRPASEQIDKIWNAAHEELENTFPDMDPHDVWLLAQRVLYQR